MTRHDALELVLAALAGREFERIAGACRRYQVQLRHRPHLTHFFTHARHIHARHAAHTAATRGDRDFLNGKMMLLGADTQVEKLARNASTRSWTKLYSATPRQKLSPGIKPAMYSQLRLGRQFNDKGATAVPPIGWTLGPDVPAMGLDKLAGDG
jgi:hypothetical protein